jgi:hypothetical protein
MDNVNNLANATMESAKKLSENELHDFMVKINILSLATLRGIHGDKFINDFLKAAQCDKNPIRITPHRMQ